MAKSNKQAILELLEEGHTLTRMEIYERVGTIKGPSRVSDLRKDGHNIDDRKVESRHGKLIKAYFMPEAIEDGTAVLYCDECMDIEKRDAANGIDCSGCGQQMEIAVSFGDYAAEIPF